MKFMEQTQMFIENMIAGHEYIVYPGILCLLLLFVVLLTILIINGISKKRRIRTLEKLIGRIESIEILDKEIQEKSIKSEALSLNFDAVREKVIRLQADLNRDVEKWMRKSSIIDLKTTIEDLNRQKEELENAINITQQTATSLIVKIKNHSLQTDELKSQKLKVEADIVTLKNQVIDLNNQLNGLNELIESKKEEERELEKKLMQLLNEIELLSNEAPPPEPPTELVRIGYMPNRDFRNDCYPAVYMPVVNSIVQLPETHQRKIKGKSESILENEFSKHFISGIYTDKMFRKANYPTYYPDFCFIDESLNIYIDIEIDEPYYYDDNGITRVAHLEGQDIQRNTAFTSNGWIVIRFSESQVVRNPQGCCVFIAKIINSVNPEFRILQDSDNVLDEESFWDESEANQFIKDRHRENYLNDIIGFAVTEENGKSDLIFTESEIQADKEANDILKPFKGINELIEFYYDKKLINKYPVSYANNLLRQLPASMAIEGEYSQSFFMSIICQSNIPLNQLENDFRLTDKKINIDATINLISRNNDSTCFVFNWKPTVLSNRYHYNVSLNDQDDDVKKCIICTALEMSLYKYILEAEYKMKIAGAYFILYNTNQNGGHFFRTYENNEIINELYTFAKQNPIR